jgi:hypothetical protein
LEEADSPLEFFMQLKDVVAACRLLAWIFLRFEGGNRGRERRFRGFGNDFDRFGTVSYNAPRARNGLGHGHRGGRRLGWRRQRLLYHQRLGSFSRRGRG